MDTFGGQQRQLDPRSSVMYRSVSIGVITSRPVNGQIAGSITAIATQQSRTTETVFESVAQASIPVGVRDRI